MVSAQVQFEITTVESRSKSFLCSGLHVVKVQLAITTAESPSKGSLGTGLHAWSEREVHSNTEVWYINGGGGEGIRTATLN